MRILGIVFFGLIAIAGWSGLAHGVSRAMAEVAPDLTKEDEIAAILDGFHQAASEADYDTYFGFFAEEAVFLGTDATERWPRREFEAFAKPIFERGQGWTYVKSERWISVSPDGQTAWFDELLENETLGQCRGSGVLVLTDEGWKITQYNLSIPIPNDLAHGFTAQSKALQNDSE